LQFVTITAPIKYKFYSLIKRHIFCKPVKLSFQKLFYILVFIFGLFAVLVLAKPVLIPLSMALFISFILLPVVKKLESWGLNKLLSAFFSLLMLFIIIAGSIALFSAEIMSLSDHLDDFSGKIMKTLTDAVVFINNNINFIDDLNSEELVENGKEWIKESSGSLIQNAFSSTAAFFTGLISTIIFTFLILIYREGLTKAFVAFGNPENKNKIFRMLKNIQSVGKQYLTGMFLLIVILGFANSIGLWIIGIDSPFLFGFMAAILSIVPYIGTTIGATIPVLYAFMSSDSLWVPIAVMGLFWGIQIIESNFLSPKIVGGSLNVNALVAILSLLIGASVWGIAGMVLFLPFAAMLKVICEEFDQLKPIAMLIGDDISGDNKKDAKISKRFEKIKGWFKKK
jgi:predicted PurR-regulated permease PerM